MDFLSKELAAYVEAHTSKEPPVLKELNRDTHANILMPRMLSGHLQGRFLSMISKMVRPEFILEIGTYTGYSGISLTEGLSEKGILYTIDINEELEGMVRSYFEKAGISHKLKYLIGNALDIIPTIDRSFDIVFIDADKINYSKYYDLVFDKVKKGGYIIADNVLWSGKVVAENIKIDKDTKALMDFNKYVQEDSRVENILLPIRDGLMIARKI